MAAAQEIRGLVVTQQEYARTHDISQIFEQLTTATIYARPANVAAFIAEQLARMQSEGKAYDPVAAGEGVQTEEQATAYMQKHGVQSVLEDLLARVLVARPASPLQFLHEEASALANAPAGKRQYFTDEDIRGMHGLHDPTCNNYISKEQAKIALRNLGLHSALAEVAEDATLTAEEFVSVARQLLDGGGN